MQEKNNHEVNKYSKKAIYSVFFEDNRVRFCIALFGAAVKSISLLGFAVFTEKIVDAVSGNRGTSVMELLLLPAVCILLLITSAFLEYHFWTSFRMHALTQYRKYTCDTILAKSIQSFEKENPADYLSALSNDLNQIERQYLEAFPYLVELIMGSAGAVFLMLQYSIRLAGIAFAVSLLPIFLSSFRMKQVEKCEEELSVENSRFTGSFAEMMEGFRPIKCLKAELQIGRKLFSDNKRASDAFGRKEHVEISVAYIASISGHVSQVVFFLLGLLLAEKDSLITGGMLIAFIQLMQNFSQLAIALPELLAGIKAGKSLMHKHEKQLGSNSSGGVDYNLTCEKAIECRGISVDYPEQEKVLSDISLKLEAGKCYAIVGESGSGKSTLLQVLAGIIRDYRGEVLYDGKDIRELSGASVFSLVSVIHQNPFIFDASIRDNITMFDETDEESVSGVIKEAGLERLIEEKTLDYICGNNGSSLSGGEKQRIAIARSILRRPKVLFIDEATSSLDEDNSRLIFNSVLNMKGITRIVITHDIYPDIMKSFDAVFTLSDGKIK